MDSVLRFLGTKVQVIHTSWKLKTLLTVRVIVWLGFGLMFARAAGVRVVIVLADFVAQVTCLQRA